MKKAVLPCVIILCICLNNAGAAITFTGGGTYDIDYLIDDYVNVWDATVNILPGATITGILNVWQYGVLNMYDGNLEYMLYAMDNGQANIYGGFIGEGYVNIYAYAGSQAEFNIYGTNFNYPYGPIPETVDWTEGTLTGTLYMGEEISWKFRFPNGSDIILHEMSQEPDNVVPVPGSCILTSLGIGLITLLRRRRTL